MSRAKWTEFSNAVPSEGGAKQINFLFLNSNTSCLVQCAFSSSFSLLFGLQLILLSRFRRKKSSNDWILSSAKAMDIEVDEDLYPFSAKDRRHLSLFECYRFSLRGGSCRPKLVQGCHGQGKVREKTWFISLFLPATRFDNEFLSLVR